MSKVAEALSEFPGSRGIMVLFEKQVHLQKEVGPECKRTAVSRFARLGGRRMRREGQCDSAYCWPLSKRRVRAMLVEVGAGVLDYSADIGLDASCVVQ